jgi:hypothetical protein
LSDLLAGWSDRFEEALVAAILARLLVAPRDRTTDRELVGALITALATREATIDRVFFDWRGGRDPGTEAYPAEPFRMLASLLVGREGEVSHPYWSDDFPCSMHIEEVEAIWAAIAERDDWSPFEAKVAAIRRMGDAVVQDAPAAA